MTALTDILGEYNEQPPEPAKPVKPAKPPAPVGYRVNLFAGAILDGGLASWLGGIALHRGFGVSVPFVAGWMLVTFALLLVFSMASMAAGAWHKEAVKAAPHLVTVETVAEEVAQWQVDRLLDAQGFLDLDAKIRNGGVK